MADSGTLTLLFTDLVNSTQLLGRAGDEDGQRIFHAHHKLMSDAISSSGGEELQWLGDGVLASFSSTADAVRCAIRIQQTARRPVEGARLEIRIGIHIGEVLRRDNGYFGVPVVMARRLCDRAAAGQILCSRLVSEMLAARQSFGFRDLGTLELKGIATPTAVSEVIYERNDAAALLNRTPFVGRAEQLKQLAVKLEDACNGHGSIAMLQGEPGIGKTRTIGEFCDLARQRGAVVLRGACYDGEWQPPYGPFAEAITDYIRHASPEDLAAAIGKNGATIARIAPALRERINGLSEPAPLDKDEERFRLLDAVAQCFITIAQRAPLVLVLDDLHWADRGTVGMLNHVAHNVPANPIMVIGAYRDAEVDRMHPLSRALAALRRLPNFEILSLKGLGNRDVVQLLEMISDQHAPEGLVQTLSSETDGNPLFIREVLLHLHEEGKILRDGQAWGSKFSVSELGIPEGVRSVIGRRLLKLSDNANRLLTVGACFKGSFSFEVAAAVAELDEDAALAAVDEALDAQLLRPGTTPETFDFTHSLIRHALYADLNPARRVRLHRRMAEAMERTWGERVKEHAAEVAYQFWCGAAASGAERGADYAIAAANNAETAYAHDEAVAFLRIALELLAKDDPRRPRLLARLGLSLAWALDSEEAVKVSREAGAMIAASEGGNAAADYFEQATRAMYGAGLVLGSWELATEGLRFIGDRRDIIWASLTEIDTLREEAEDPNNPGIRADSPRQRERRALLKKLSRDELREHEIEVPYDSRQEVLDNPDASAFALLFFACDYQRALPRWQHEASDAERRGRIAWAMSAWAGVARCHTGMGDLAAAQAAYDRARTWQARIDAPSVELLNLLQAQQDLRIALDVGWEELLAPNSGPRLMAINPSAATHWSHGAIAVTASSVLARLNLPDRAMQWLTIVPRALEIGAPWTGAVNIITSDATLALWLMNRNDYCAVVERCIREKLLIPDFRFPMRDSRLNIARLCALQHRYDEASDWFVKAREVLDEQGARPLRAITDYDEALMYLRRSGPGDRNRAEPLLAAASHQFEKIGMTGWIRRAHEASASPAVQQHLS